MKIISNSLKYLYECLEDPFKLGSDNSDNRKWFKHILDNIALTKELSNAINHFHNLKGIYLVPRLAKIRDMPIEYADRCNRSDWNWGVI